MPEQSSIVPRGRHAIDWMQRFVWLRCCADGVQKQAQAQRVRLAVERTRGPAAVRHKRAGARRDERKG
jgi:hypothetical protein